MEGPGIGDYEASANALREWGPTWIFGARLGLALKFSSPFLLRVPMKHRVRVLGQDYFGK